MFCHCVETVLGPKGDRERGCYEIAVVRRKAWREENMCRPWGTRGMVDEGRTHGGYEVAEVRGKA